MIDDEMHYLFKYFTERIHYLTRIITRCQQEGNTGREKKDFLKFFTIFLSPRST